MTDHDLLEQFERATLPPEHFHHREHVRVAFLYLSKYSVLEALQKFCAALRKFAAAHGKPQLYHQTITWAYVFLIGERMARAGHKLSWEDFARDNPDLLIWKNGLLQRYYREETLNSDLAKSNFILPDKRD